DQGCSDQECSEKSRYLQGHSLLCPDLSKDSNWKSLSAIQCSAEPLGPRYPRRSRANPGPTGHRVCRTASPFPGSCQFRVSGVSAVAVPGWCRVSAPVAFQGFHDSRRQRLLCDCVLTMFIPCLAYRLCVLSEGNRRS